MEKETKGGGYFSVLRADDDEIRSSLKGGQQTARLLWFTLERIANERHTNLVSVRLGLLAHLAGISKRCVQERAQDLAALGFLEIRTHRAHEGNMYKLLRGMNSGVELPTVKPEAIAADQPEKPCARALSILQSTGKFPTLTREALVMVARGYPGILDAHCDDIAERAKVCATNAIGDPVAWLRRRLSEIESKAQGSKESRPREMTPDEIRRTLGPPAGEM